MDLKEIGWSDVNWIRTGYNSKDEGLHVS